MPNEEFFAGSGVDPAAIATAPPPPQPAAPAQIESSEALFNRLTKPEPEPEPAPTKPEVKEAKSDDGIPEQFLGKKAEPKEDPDLIFTEEPKGPLKHENYKRVQQEAHKRVQEAQKRLQEYETKVKELESRQDRPETLERLTQLEQTIAEREAALERVSVQETPKFKERFTQRETAISDSLKQYATELGLDADKLDNALRSGLKRRAEILDELDMSPTTNNAVTALMTQHDMLQKDKTAFLSQSKEELARHQQEQTRAVAEQDRIRTEQEDKIFSQTSEKIAKTYAPFQKVEGQDAWNAQVEANHVEAKKYFNGQKTLEDLAEIVHLGVGAKSLTKINESLVKRLTSAQEELASLKSGQPGSNGGIPAPNGKVPESKDPRQRAMDTFNSMVQPQNNGFQR